MLETFEAWDKTLFLYLNGDGGAVWDRIMILISEKFFWIPVYLILIWLLYRSFGVKGVLFAFLAVAVQVTLTDQISVQLFKFQFERPRPCQIPEWEGVIHNPVSCAGPYGFVSSHAANFFGLSTLIGLSLRRAYPRLLPWLYLWATLIGYSRVYLGKHFLGDVIGGALLGILLGYLVYLGYRYLLRYTERSS